MDPFHFTCPHCGAHLKTRDRLSVGRQVNCPECQQPFEIVQTGAGLTTEKHEVPTPPVPTPAIRSNRSLVAVVLILAGLLSLTVALTWRQFPTRPDRSPVATNRGSPKPAPHDAQLPKPAPVKPQLGDGPESRLQQLGAALASASKADKTFPSGGHRAGNLGIDEWFGWMTTLMGQVEPDANIPVVRDRGWRDPLNDAFVRRRIPAFQNPAVKALAGDDGYPAAHFAGVAGVGDDAARLPAEDPRAGIFAYDRRTRYLDVRDGLGQTMLVTGVTTHLGSWASATATVRPFSQQPYVNGPDGFGTGQADAMFVLMADGRVTSLSARTDPAVIRRMAAMSDEKQSIPAVDVPLARGPDDEPIEPVHSKEEEVPPELAVVPIPVKSVDQIEISLKQSISSYTFPPGTAIRLVVLKEVAELAGVPLKLDDATLGPARKKLDAPLGPVPAPLTNTTVSDILAALLDPVDLKIVVEPGQLRLVPKRTE